MFELFMIIFVVVCNSNNYNTNVSNYTTGIYTIAIFRNLQEVESIQFLIAH